MNWFGVLAHVAYRFYIYGIIGFLAIAYLDTTASKYRTNLGLMEELEDYFLSIPITGGIGLLASAAWLWFDRESTNMFEWAIFVAAQLYLSMFLVIKDYQDSLVVYAGMLPLALIIVAAMFVGREKVFGGSIGAKVLLTLAMGAFNGSLLQYAEGDYIYAVALTAAVVLFGEIGSGVAVSRSRVARTESKVTVVPLMV